MKYGLIGEHLPHSFSKEIHESIADYSYELCELSSCELDSFMRQTDFKGINVTIPYKQTVMPYLNEIDPAAREVGAVNTIVNKNGKLYGYNTDFYGLRALTLRVRRDLTRLHVLILGTGGTSRTAKAVAADLGAKKITVIGRRAGDGVITYEEAYETCTDAQFIINTTPCGMFPNQDGTDKISAVPIDISRFPALVGVVDAVYNPLRTNLVVDAIERGIAAEGGLYMLTAQAVKASEIFRGCTLDDGVTERVFADIKRSKENIILTGMPGSGKSTVGKALAWKLDRQFVDTDDLIVKKAGRQITDIFAELGESGFRDIESEVIREAAATYSGAVIATGGGAILRDANVRALKRCGMIFFINRPLSAIIPTGDRPLSSNEEALKRRFEERYDRYLSTCNFEIKTDEVIAHTVDNITGNFLSL